MEPEASMDERNWGMACHLASFAGYVFPIGNILGPLVVWLMKREEYPLVNDQGKEAINFQISITIYLIVSLILMLVVIGFLLVLILAILDIVLTIMAAIAANRGERYRYPLTIRFVK